MQTQPGTLLATCRCGGVRLEASRTPIAATICYCASCQEAGRRLAALPGAEPVLRADGGTAYLLYRKDRVRCLGGGERLEAHRLKPDSPTRRMVAACCKTAFYLEFTRGHWLSLYRDRLPPEAPQPEMRVMVSDRRPDVVLPNDMPAYAKHNGRLMVRLLKSWVAMGFRVPKVEGIPP